MTAVVIAMHNDPGGGGSSGSVSRVQDRLAQESTYSTVTLGMCDPGGHNSSRSVGVRVTRRRSPAAVRVLGGRHPERQRKWIHERVSVAVSAPENVHGDQQSMGGRAVADPEP